MKFLLVNENVAVRKLFNISAKKADISLDIVDCVANIPMQEDYSYIFVDDGVVDIDSIRNLRNKMITTKFCLILSKNADASGRFSNFDKYIRKPFLPIDVYEVLKKEKYNDMNLNTNYDSVSDDNMDISVADGDLSLDNNLLQATDVSDIDMDNISASINDIDLSDFNDNQDEFITGSMNELDSIPVENNSYGFMDDIGIMPSEIQANNTQKPVDNLESSDIGEYVTNESPMIDNDFGSNDNIKSNKVDSDIDFSSVFALQDEILQTQDQEKKNIIGGDISIRKDSKQNNNIELNDIAPNYVANDIVNDNPSDFSHSIQDEARVTTDLNLNMESNDYNSFTSDNNPMNVDINDNESNSLYSIENMSEQELEALDDEALIKLQEHSSISNDTMILDKQTIDEVNNILVQTEDYNANADSVKIASQDFNSLTEEALSEVLQEDISNEINYIKDDIPSNANFINNDPQVNIPPPTSPNIKMNDVSDIAEIIKAFPIDKLRELLSGAQITINITFPSKNN